MLEAGKWEMGNASIKERTYSGEYFHCPRDWIIKIALAHCKLELGK